MRANDRGFHKFARNMRAKLHEIYMGRSKMHTDWWFLLRMKLWGIFDIDRCGDYGGDVCCGLLSETD